MDREKAVKKITDLQDMIRLHVKKETIATERFIPTSYGKVRVLEYGLDSPERKPLFIDIHGGGWALLSPEYDEPINLRIIEKTGIKIISIDYPKAPQNPHPIGIEATYEVIKHYFDNADDYGIDRDNIGIGGYSSGGNFATVVCIKANERKDIKIKYQIMCYPGTDAAGDPYKKPRSEKVLSNEDIECFCLCYVPDPEDARSPYASPVYSTKDQLTGLPPALLIVAGHNDPLSPEDMLYGKKLEDAGVIVETHRFEDAFHGFMQDGEPDAEEAIRIMIDFIEKERDRQ